MTEHERNLLIKNGPEIMRTTVWLSDLKDFPGLTKQINVVIKCNYGRIIKLCTNFMTIEHRKEVNLYDSHWVRTLPVA